MSQVAAPLPAASIHGSGCCKIAGTVSCCCLCSIHLGLFPVLQLCSVHLCSTLPREVPLGAPLGAGVCLDAGARSASLRPGLSSCLCVDSLLTLKVSQSLGSLPPPRPAPSWQLQDHNVASGLWGTSSPRWDCSFWDVPGVKQILQRPSMALGHLPEGVGAQLTDAAATGFAV